MAGDTFDQSGVVVSSSALMPHPGVEAGHRCGLREQATVDVRERLQVVVEGCGPLILRGVEDFEELRDQWADVGAVRAGAVTEVVLERFRFEDAGVVREVTEHEPHQEKLEPVPDVPRVVERLLVETGHTLGRVTVDR